MNKGISIEHSCESPYIQGWKLEMMAEQVFDRYIENADKVMDLSYAMLEKHIADQEELPDNTDVIRRKQGEIEKLMNKRTNLIEMRAEGDIDKEMFRSKKQEIEDRVAKLTEEIKGLQPEKEQTSNEDYSVKLLELRERLKEYTGFDYSVIPESIVEAFIERIWVSKDEFRWYLRTGNNADGEFDPDDHIKIGAFTLTIDDFKIGERYGRVLFLREYASYIKDSMVAEMTDLNRNLMMSIDVIPVPTDEAVREAESRLLGVETNATNWQRRQNANNNFSAQLPYDIEQQRKEMKEFLDDLTTRDQRMMFAVLTMVHTADTKEQLDNDTEALLTTARKHLCQFGILKFQQLDGLNTAMPFGVRKIESFRTLTTESLAVFIPFRVQDICHTNGVYYGQNVISKNMIIADRRQLLNGNEFILGVSGGGKSFTAKGEIINQVLAGDADIIIIDPEREYSPLVRALGGEIINISATSPTHINAMDMNREYGDGANPVILKSEFIMSLCEQLIGGNNLGAVQKSIIDRCTASVYRTYQQNNYTGEVPTLQDFRAELLKQS